MSWPPGPVEKELKVIRAMLVFCGYTPTPVTADLCGHTPTPVTPDFCGQEVFTQGAPTSAVAFSLSASLRSLMSLWFSLLPLRQAAFRCLQSGYLPVMEI